MKGFASLIEKIKMVEDCKVRVRKDDQASTQSRNPQGKTIWSAMN